MRSPGRLSVASACLAAFLIGAAGLALELLAVESAGLALGYGRSAVLGLAAFVAGWACGAYAAGRLAHAARGGVVAAGICLALCAAPLLFLSVVLASRLPASFLAEAAALAAIVLPAALSGAFLPWLVRLVRGRSALAVVWAANLAGAVCGAELAHSVAAAYGRVPAGGAAGVAALAAGACAWFAARGGARDAARAGERSSAAPGEAWGAASGEPLSRAQAGVSIGLVTVWMLALETVGLRLGTLWIGGMEPALAALVEASLLALAAGAVLLPALLPRGRDGVFACLWLCALASLWPLFAHGLAAPLLAGERHDLVRALLLVGPALVPFGAWLPVVARATVGPGTTGAAASDGAAHVGGLVVHEAWGAALGLPLFVGVAIPRAGLAGTVAACIALGAVVFLVLARRAPGAPVTSGARLSDRALIGAGAAAVLAAVAATRPDPALASPPLLRPELVLRSFAQDRHFAVAVVDDGLLGERTLLTDGFRAAGTGRDYLYMRALGSLPLLLHERPSAVCVLALGTGTTLGEVVLHERVERVDVLEISRAVADAAPLFALKNHGALDDPRVALVVGDGRRSLAERPGAYDVVTLEPLLPDAPAAVYLYTGDFYDVARRALRPGGLVCQWVPPHALEPATFDAVLQAFRSRFAWSGTWVFGTQVILVGGDERPRLAEDRFPAAGTPLAASLAELGLATAGELVAGLVAEHDASGAGASARLLSDLDPWIVYRPRRAGAVLLGDLPVNLGRLRLASGGPSEEFLADLDGDAVSAARAAWRARAALSAARERHACDEALARGVEPPYAALAPRLPAGEAEPPRASVEALLRGARAARSDDPARAAFEEELAFLASLRAGVAALASGADEDAARAALEPLVRAAKLRPERADAHLYAAVALERLGRPAEPVIELVRARCPGIAATPAGRRARELGLSDAAWRALSEALPAGGVAGVVPADEPGQDGQDGAREGGTNAARKASTRAAADGGGDRGAENR